MVKMKDIAKELGLSIMTISRVINNKGNVKEETRKAIMDAIKHHNYYPNKIGRGLTKRAVNTLGVLVPNYEHVIHENQYYAELLIGIEESCITNSYNMLISTQRTKEQEFDYLKLYYEHLVDGMIILVPNMHNPQMDVIEREQIPCVVIGERSDDKQISYVDTDNVEGIIRAIEYLYNMGHREIAFIKGEEFVRDGRDRVQGFYEGMKKFGLAIRDEWVLPGDFGFPTGKTSIDKLVKLGKLPSALISSNDVMALGALAEASERGLKVPDELSIIGYDGIPMARFMHPRLTTMKQPLVQMGREAAEILFRMLKNPGHGPEHKIFPVEFLEGQTVKDLR